MNLLICIGCNEYDDRASLQPLQGAEADAQQVFDALAGTGGIYDNASSTLLLSPTLDEVLNAISSRLFDSPKPELFTLFFAGHACVAQGSLHLALKDTRTDRLSMTALGMARVLEMIAEAQPHVANIVLDACQAAGSHYDLHALLKPDILGKAGGSSVIFLGACMADQYANEDSAGGIATTSLLRHVSGEVKLQDTRPTLDLLELGLAVSEDVSASSSGMQSPTCWAVALFGYGAFSANPHYQIRGTHPAYTIESISPGSTAGQAVVAHSEELWEEHRRLRAEWVPKRTYELLHRVVSKFGNNPSDAVRFLRAISRSLRLRAATAEDALAESDVVALSAVLLFPHLGSPDCQALAEELIREWLVIAGHSAVELADMLRREQFALLEGGLGEFHYLPLKVSRILGWLGTIAHVEDSLGLAASTAVGDTAVELARQYFRSAIAVSEAQAPEIYLMITGLRGRCQSTLLRDLMINYLKSALECGGHFLTTDARPENIVAYTAIRSGLRIPIDSKDLAQPSELLSVLFQCARSLNMTDLDGAIHMFDRRWVSSFVPTEYSDFGQPVIASGTNFHQQVGFGAWTLKDVDDRVGQKVRSAAQAASAQLPAVGRPLCALASHLLGDRVPYLFPLAAMPATPSPVTASQTGSIPN